MNTEELRRRPVSTPVPPVKSEQDRVAEMLRETMGYCPASADMLARLIIEAKRDGRDAQREFIALVKFVFALDG